MTEYDFSPGAYHAYQQKLQGVGNWAQEVSKHKPTNPFVTPADRESDFYTKSKTGTRSKSSSTANHRKAKSSVSHQRRGYQTDFVDSDSDSDGGPDRPPTPTNGPSYGFSGPYGNPAFGPRYAPWPTNGGYVSPPVQYPQQQQRPQQPIVISNVTGHRLIPTFNQQANAWEFRDPAAASIRPPRSSRKTKRRGSSVPPGQGQMLGGVGGFIYPGQSPPTSQPLLSPPLSGPYGNTQPAMSAMYLPSGHTSPASIQYSLPQSAPNPSSMQAQQQQALQVRYQQQQQQMRGSAPVIPIVSGISLPVMHMQGFAQKQQPMMSPPLNGMTTTYTGYPGPSTSPNTGYLSASNASITSVGGQPIASVVLDSGKRKKDKEREKEKEGSSFFGMLGRKKR